LDGAACVFMMRRSGSITFALAGAAAKASGAFGVRPRFFCPVAASSAGRASILACCCAVASAASCAKRSWHAYNRTNRLC
jgi:hypothetical protein